MEFSDLFLLSRMEERGGGVMNGVFDLIKFVVKAVLLLTIFLVLAILGLLYYFHAL